MYKQRMSLYCVSTNVEWFLYTTKINHLMDAKMQYYITYIVKLGTGK